MATSTPTDVASPRPPRRPSGIGQLLPATADNPMMASIDPETPTILATRIGSSPLRPSSTATIRPRGDRSPGSHCRLRDSRFPPR